MSKIPLLAADTYTVINKTTLYDTDRSILISFYQPIIGCNAINLYFTLWSYLDRNEIMSMDWTHHHLITSMQIGLERIIEAREKLEAMGLIKTYIKEDKDKNINSYIYEIYSPLRVSEFLIDPILSTLLHDSIGDLEYKKLVDDYRIPNVDLKEYTDISSKFNDIFMTTSVVDTLNVEEVKKINKLGISYEPTIDLNNVLSLIPSEMLNIRSVNKTIKELIYKLALVYNYNDDQMRDLIMNSINESHRIDSTMLKNNARRLYKFENNNKVTELVYKNQPEYLRNKTTNVSKKEKMIYTFETLSPYDFLASKNGCVPTKSETDILNYLLIDVNLTPGVVNVLIDYMLTINDNKLIKSFVENKAVEWKRKNIETVKDAMEMAKKDRQIVKSTRKTVNVEKPVWFDKNVDKEEASLEEQQAFLERLKSIE